MYPFVTSSSANSTQSIRALNTAMAAGRQDARERGKSTLLRIHVPLPFADPWSLLDGVKDEMTFAWHDGQSGLRLASRGIHTRITWFSPSELNQVRDLCLRWAERSLNCGLEEDEKTWEGAPLFLGGLAFDTSSSENAQEWNGWPPGEMWIPHLLAYRQGDHEEEGGLIIHLNLDEESSAHQVIRSVEEILASLQESPENQPSSTTISWNPIEEPSSWIQRVENAKEAIRQSPLQKVVLCRSIEGTSADKRFSPMGSLRRLHAQHGEAYAFSIGREDGTHFIGATPETLVRVGSGEVETHALAGSAPRGNTPEEDRRLAGALIECAKNREEHALVLDAIEQGLAPLCDRMTVDPEPQIVVLRELQHLCSEVQGALKPDRHVLDIVDALHPTPAVSGWPTTNAHQWLRKHECLQRGWYAGAIGWLNNSGDGVFAVGIRSAVLRGNTAVAFAGAGIVPDSSPEAEWTETEWKLSTIQNALTLDDGAL